MTFRGELGMEVAAAHPAEVDIHDHAVQLIGPAGFQELFGRRVDLHLVTGHPQEAAQGSAHPGIVVYDGNLHHALSAEGGPALMGRA